jgi:sn-glycerol 3-phosphate transport system substrate-binding protein
LKSALTRRDTLRAFAGLAMTGCGRRLTHEDGRVVVHFWYAFGDSVRKTLLDLVARYNASQHRFVVKPVFQGDYFESLAKLRTALAAGRAPGLAHVVAEIVPYLANAGVLEPLDDYEDARALPFVPSLDQFGAFRGGDGRRWSVPFNRSTPIMYANADALASAGVALPETWNELVTSAHALTRKEASGETRFGLEIPISWWYWVAMVGQAGGTLADDTGKVTLGGPAGERALQFWERLVYEEGVMRPPPGRDYGAWQSMNESFLAGRIGLMWNSTAYVRYLEDNAHFRVVTAPLPRETRAAVPTGGTFFVLMRDAPSDEKLGAWDFVRWMSAPEQTAEWATRTGYMPVTLPAVERLERNGWYAKHPNDRVAYDQLPNVDPWPWLGELFRVERDILDPRLEEAILLRKDPHEVLEHARAEAARHL